MELNEELSILHLKLDNRGSSLICKDSTCCMRLSTLICRHEIIHYKGHQTSQNTQGNDCAIAHLRGIFPRPSLSNLREPESERYSIFQIRYSHLSTILIPECSNICRNRRSLMLLILTILLLRDSIFVHNAFIPF